MADIRILDGPAQISRELAKRRIVVAINVRDRDLGGFVEELQRKAAQSVKLPSGYYFEWGGQFENQQRAIARLKVIVPLSIFSIFVLLFWVFGSMRRAILVLLMVPFTLIGGLAGLGIAGLHLSVSAAVGFIAVAGISVQNGVIMVEQIVELLRRERDALRARLAQEPTIEDASHGEVHEVYVDSLAAELTGWSNVGDRLAAAFANDEFCLYAQRIQALGPGGRAMHEVLIRLREEEENLMPPGAFLPLAERHGLMPQLDRWVVRHVLDWVAAAPARRQAIYSLNVAPSTIEDESFGGDVWRLLHERELPGSVLCFEFDALPAIAAVRRRRCSRQRRSPTRRSPIFIRPPSAPS